MHLHSQIKDEVLRQKLTPSYRLGCKRALIADDYYPTLLRENVELITDPIAQVQPHSIVTEDGRERPTDVIIYGTGFDVAGPFRRLAIIGRASRLRRVARRDAQLFGPGGQRLSELSHAAWLQHRPRPNSVIIMIEAQARHIIEMPRSDGR